MPIEVAISLALLIGICIGVFIERLPGEVKRDASARSL